MNANKKIALRSAVPAAALWATVLVLCFARQSPAVPALPDFQVLQQADGSTVKARQWGDERTHGWEAESGYSLVFDETLNSWTYAEKAADGGLKSSGKIAGKDNVPAGLLKNMRPSAKYRAGTPLKRSTREGRRHVYKPASPARGTQATAPSHAASYIVTANVPVILINFSGTTTTYTGTDFTSLMFGTGTLSMKDYYEEASYGAFSVSSGPSGITGWYTALHDHFYYGRNAVGGFDAYPGTLVREAVAQADADMDFSAYDQDGDCYVDVVDIVHQGTGEEAGGPADDIWSHRWDLNSAAYYGYSDGGEYTTNDLCTANSASFVKVNDYVIQPETMPTSLGGGMATIGVFAHEYGHSLGLPDLYDTDYTSNGIGNWSIMAGGSWNYVTKPGDSPAHFDAWSKYFLGWAEPTQVNGTLGGEPIDAASTAPDIYQLLGGTPLSGEYFLVENRQLTGFDAGLPGAGLLIWHIDGAYIDSHLSANTVNDTECYPPSDCSSNHFGVALVQADNQWQLEKGTNSGDTGDPYSASTNSAFSNATSPGSALYSGSTSSVSVTGISASASTMTATFSAPADLLTITGPAGVPEATSASYAAAMHWSGGSTETVMPAWSVWTGSAGAVPAAIDVATGLLSAATITGNPSITVRAEYVSGSRTFTASKTVTILELVPLSDALDNVASFTTGGDAAWYGQTFASNDGVDAARSGAVTASQTTWMETSVTGDGSGFFYWKVSSDPLTVLRFLIDSVQATTAISGETAWARVDFSTTGAGSHTLRWEYEGSGSATGEDAGWVDQVMFVPVSCGTATLSPTNASYDEAGGASSFTVTVDPSCSWTALSNDAWITVTGGASGTGSGSVSYSVSANTGPARTGTITAAGQTFTVSQSTATCAYQIAPTSVSLTGAGGTGTITVTAGSWCSWSSTSNDAWISITSGASGAGDGSLSYSVSENTGPSRTGTITAAGQTFTIAQATSSDGDLDGGGVSVTDALRALRIAAGLQTATNTDLLHGDVAPLVSGMPQPDQKIDISDVTAILRKSIELISW